MFSTTTSISVFHAKILSLRQFPCEKNIYDLYLKTVKNEPSRQKESINMPKIAICDDDQTMLIKMKDYLKEYEALFSIDTFQSGEALLAAQENYDFIFLDIDMKGISGIDAARMIRQKDKKAKLIYVTAYEDFKDYAFAVHAFAYLVKPVNKEKIQDILREALAYTQDEDKGASICLMTENGLLDINIRDIYYFEYQNRRLCMATVSGNVWIQDSIKNMFHKMETWDFLMSHKSFIVNLYHIKNLKGYNIFMTNGSIVPLSQKKSSDFRKKLAVYLASRI